jgi:hypothetical protein
MTSPIAYRMSIARKRDQRTATQPALGSPLDLDGAWRRRTVSGICKADSSYQVFGLTPPTSTGTMKFN